MAAEPFKYDGALNGPKKRKILSFCKGVVLEVGCNTGELAGFLNATGVHSEGIDISPDLIQIARRRFPNVKFHVGSDLSQFRDHQFETVIAWDVLEHIPDDVSALKEFVRVASINVVLSVPKEDAISLPHSRVTYRPYVDPTHVHYYTRERLAEMVYALGDCSLRVEDAYRVRPLLAYEKIGIPKMLCSALDQLFWMLGKNRSALQANLVAEICKKQPQDV